MAERCRNSRDPEMDYRDVNEFGFGPGLVPPGKEDAPPSEGGVYRAMCPPVELTPSADLSVRARETRWKRATRHGATPASASADANRSARSRGGVMSFRRPVAGARPNHLGFRATAILLRNVIEATTPPSQRMSMPVR